MVADRISHDSAYKKIFKNQDVVRSLIAEFTPKEYRDHFDLTSLELCSGSYVSPDLRERHEDLVWRIRRKDKSWCYIYLLLEFQTNCDKWMAVRVMGYVALLWQDLIDQGLIEDGKLPPVFPIVLYRGNCNWTAKTDIKLMCDLVDGLPVELQIGQNYLLIDENKIPKPELSASKGILARIFEVEQASDDNELVQFIDKLISVLKRPECSHLRAAITNWLSKLLASRVNVDANFDEIEDETNVEDIVVIEERVAQWRNEISANAALNATQIALRGTITDMLVDRFGLLPQSITMSLNKVTNVDDLRHLSRNVYQTENLSSFEQRINDLCHDIV